MTRSSFTTRHKRQAQVAAGALILAVPGSSIALAATAPASTAPTAAATTAPTAAAAATPQETLHVDLQRRHVGYDDAIVANGNAGRASAGRTVELQFDPAGGPGWATLARTTVSRTGSFHFDAKIHRSGRVRVSALPAATHATTKAPATSGPLAASATGGVTVQPDASSLQLLESPVAPVTVTGELKVKPQTMGALGKPVDVHGYLLPGIPHRHVSLLANVGGKWKRVAGATTMKHGGFDLTYNAPAGSESLRVGFDGDRFNTPTSAPAGTVTALHQTFVSWYEDAGATACGFHAYYGVANLSLPCGTKVTFSNGSTTIVATVDDRGPYVGGREFDLNQNVASALGFSGIGDVWASA